MLRFRIIPLLISFTLLLAAGLTPVPVRAAVPPGFSDTPVTTVTLPTDLAFTPDGRLLITTQPGRLYIYQNGTLLPNPALDLTDRICSNGERGLLGIAVDPGFTQNRFIYLYYTFRRAGSCITGNDTPEHPVNRVVRFTLLDPNVIDPASELVLVDNIRSAFGNHNAGDLAFGSDGLLYISTGDGGSSGPADDLDSLAGKILRIDPQSASTIPASNPFAGAAGVRRCGDPAGLPEGNGPCGEIIAYGLRNPFRIAFEPDSGALFINDVGQNAWEEINRWQPTAAGAPNYGWPAREGPCAYPAQNDCEGTPTGLTGPIYFYPHSSGCRSITGGAFVPAGAWPDDYAGGYLFADYVCGKIFLRSADGAVSEFATGLGSRSAVSLIFGPSANGQALYYTTYGDGGQVRSIVSTTTPAPPPRRSFLPLVVKSL